MAAKRKPAITGMHSQGIVDDIIVPLAKKVLKGRAQNKVLSAVRNSAYKGSAKAADKFDKAVKKKVLGESFFGTKAHANDPWVTPNRSIKKQLGKNYGKSDLGNAIGQNQSTRGVVRNGKRIAKGASVDIPNPFGPKTKYHSRLSPAKIPARPRSK